MDKFVARIEQNPTKQDIVNHRFFQYMDICIQYHIDSIRIENKYKEAVCKDFLKLKFSISRKMLFDLFNDDILYALPHDDFKNRIELEVEHIVKSYNEEAVKIGIPEAFVDKFRMWHSNTLNMTLIWAKDICDSKWINGNLRTALFLQNIFMVAFMVTITDAEKTIGAINGAFVGQEYKGIVCLPDKH